MAYVRETEPALGEDTAERPSAEEWAVLLEEAFAKPVPVYDWGPVRGLVTPRPKP
jgi:hypothetical protein